MEDSIKPVGNPPRGWHMKNEYIDDDGNVFNKGDFLYNKEEQLLKKQVSKLRKQITELKIDKDFKLKTWDYNKSLNEYLELTKYIDEQIESLNKELRLIRPYETQNIPDGGEVMTLNEFKNSVKNGGFVDSDGYGLYVETSYEGTKEDPIEILKMTDVPIFPSDIKEKLLRYKLNKVVWFNK